MRLLRRKSDDDFELVTFADNGDDIPSYAILSHTWIAGEEVTYKEIVDGTGKNKAGYAKIRFCGERAMQDGLEWWWVDSCCIDKSTSEELTTAINSMFRWYQRASKCYVYLSDVHVPEEVPDVQAYRITWDNSFRRSRWFTRGWTLQELLAPASVEFFDKGGRRLGSKISLEREIHEITQIPVAAFRGKPLPEFDVDERMSWTAKRRTTVAEDKAYCLLGIFGVFMPLIYGEGEDHAIQRLTRKLSKISKGKGARDSDDRSDLSDEVSQLRLGQRTQPRPLSNVPFRRDTDFVVRGDLLARIEERCSQPAGRAALVGFGGFGKSQLAVEYAYHVRQKSPNTWVFWVYASNSARLEAAFRDIADIVLPARPDAAVDTIQLVRKWLCNEANGRWLIIVDNVDTEVVLEMQEGKGKISLLSLLPQCDHGSILITSRNADVARSLVGREKDIIPVGAMTDDEAVQLLENYLGTKSVDGAIRLVQTLDCIPLAIVQAAAYINRLGSRMSVTRYLGELEKTPKQAQLLRNNAVDLRRDDQASNSVFNTWQISFDHIYQKRPSATSLLSFMSFFNRQGIPEFMIRHYTDKDVTRVEEDDGDFDEDLAVLRAFSLVRTTQREDEFEMHRLVQLATQEWLGLTGTMSKWSHCFIHAMAQEFPGGNYANWPKCQTLFSHVSPLLGRESFNNEKTAEFALVLFKAGWYASEQARFAIAAALMSKSLEIRKEVFGPDHPTTLESANVLGNILGDSGKHKESELIHRQTVATRERVLGKEHPDTLTSISRLAAVLIRQEKFEEANILYQQNLISLKKVLGPRHPETLMTMNNIASVLDHQGKFEEAEAILRETLAAREKVLGKEYPETLTTMNNIALVLISQGKYKEAEAMNRPALAAQEKVLGKDHLDTIGSVYCLAFLLSEQKRYDEALPLYERAYAGLSAVLGDDHPTTRGCRRNHEDAIQSRELHQYHDGI